MSEKRLETAVRRISLFASVIDIHGEISGVSETALNEAYAQAVGEKVHSIILNFTGLEYMSSLGIGMLVTMVIRAQRDGKKLVAFGLSEHYRRIFSITRLDQVLPVYESEQVALASAERMDLPEREY